MLRTHVRRAHMKKMQKCCALKTEHFCCVTHHQNHPTPLTAQEDCLVCLLSHEIAFKVNTVYESAPVQQPTTTLHEHERSPSRNSSVLMMAKEGPGHFLVCFLAVFLSMTFVWSHGHKQWWLGWLEQLSCQREWPAWLPSWVWCGSASWLGQQKSKSFQEAEVGVPLSNLLLGWHLELNLTFWKQGVMQVWSVQESWEVWEEKQKKILLVVENGRSERTHQNFPPP